MLYIAKAILCCFIALILLMSADVGPGDAFLVGTGGAMIWWGLESLTERAHRHRIFNEELAKRLDGERARILDEIDSGTEHERQIADLFLGDVERVADALRKQGAN